MSYSFQVRGSNKAEAIAKVKEELAKVVAAQPIHEVDQQQAIAAAESFVALLSSDETQDVGVSVSGSCGSVNGSMTNVGVNVFAYILARE